jgi:hypothetical protein
LTALVVIIAVAMPPIPAISLSILQIILVAAVTMILLPFHFPLPVFKFLH